MEHPGVSGGEHSADLSCASAQCSENGGMFLLTNWITCHNNHDDGLPEFQHALQMGKGSSC